MAYMNQDKKKIIAAELKKVVPASWKYSLKVGNHSTLHMTIRQADIPAADMVIDCSNDGDWDYQLNDYYPENTFQGETLKTIRQIIDALNTGNWDKSDIQTDYFNVGHYIGVSFRVGVLTDQLVEVEETIQQDEKWVVYNENNNRILSIVGDEATAESDASFWSEEENLENVAWTTQTVFNHIESSTATIH